MRYKEGDKVVVEITLKAEDSGRRDPYKVGYDNDNGHSSYIGNTDILGKLEDFQPTEKKIKMTVEEKKEFNKLKMIHKSLFWALHDIDDEEYPNLFDCLFVIDDEEHHKAQLKFARAWGKPSLIKVEKEKKYYVHLFKSQESGYLNQVRESLKLGISDSDETNLFKTEFTKDEIENLKDVGFKINNDALEEVENE